MKFWACDVYQWDLYNSAADTNIKSNATCNADWEMNNKRSSEDVRWRSFLRWGTVKVKLLETNAPQKILMIRFETKTWLMENQVKLSCFSPVSVHLEIWLQLFWRLLDQNQSRFDSEAAAEAGRFYNYTKRAFTG